MKYLVILGGRGSIYFELEIQYNFIFQSHGLQYFTAIHVLACRIWV